ncbi:MAG TPA: hypothetical protein VJ179_00325 [Patescibacteria group bacterium]|nr:hypothetical protein [Patescibacteria group bacterium]
MERQSDRTKGAALALGISVTIFLIGSLYLLSLPGKTVPTLPFPSQNEASPSATPES